MTRGRKARLREEQGKERIGGHGHRHVREGTAQEEEKKEVAGEAKGEK